jgi:sugar phosphate isomerase/epimerase
MTAPHESRRSFLRQTVGLAGATAIGGWVGIAPSAAPAIEPLRRGGPSFFKFSLAAYGYRDLLQGNPPAWSLDDFVDACAEMQLDGTELTSYYFPAEPSDDFLYRLKRRCFLAGLSISGTAVGNDFCVPKGPERDRELAHVKRWVDYAAKLGAPVIRIFSGDRKPDQSTSDAQRLAIEGMEECCAYAGSKGVSLALENHGGLTATAEGMLELVRGVQSEWFGVNLDSGNFATADVYRDLAKLAPYATNVQVKLSVRPGGGAKQHSDLKRLAQMLRDVGYRGWIVLEYEEDEDPRKACPRAVEAIRAAFA